MKDHHLLRWGWHPNVSADDRSFGERSADKMKNALATWPALIGMAVFITIWMLYNGSQGFDPYPWILLNLCLSTLAGLQCFVLLIANKRGEQIAAQLAQHTFENTELLKQLIEQNNTLTEAVHLHIVGDKP